MSSAGSLAQRLLPVDLSQTVEACSGRFAFRVRYPGGTHTHARQLRAGALAEGLQDHGYQVGVGRIKRLRRTLNIRCVQKHKFRATTNSNHDLLVAPNRLEQNFVATRPAVWVTAYHLPRYSEGPVVPGWH